MTQPGQNVTFDSAGAPAHGFLAMPPEGTGAGVLLIQEWWGLDDHMIDVARRLAAEGFVVLAPDLYGGRVTHDSGDAAEMMMSVPVEDSVRKLTGAVDYLLGLDAVTSTAIGAVGFCMGGGFVLRLAAVRGDAIAAAVPFYGVGPAVPDSFRGLTAAVQGHYGEQDTSYPVAKAHEQELQIRTESGADVTFFYYPAGHAFHNDANTAGTYDAASAELAWQRTLDFLRERVR